MSVTRMKFLSIVGLKDYFDEFVMKYLVSSGMQIENALGMLESVKGLTHYEDTNPYGDLVKKCSYIASVMGFEKELKQEQSLQASIEMTPEEIRSFINELEESIRTKADSLERINDQLNEYSHIQKQLELLMELDVEINDFFSFEFIKFRFGKMPKKNYKQLQLYVDELEALVIPVSQDQDNMWMIYFTPRSYGDKIDGIFSSLHFERTRLSGELKGTPREALDTITKKIEDLEASKTTLISEMNKFTRDNLKKAVNAYTLVMKLNRINEIRRYSAHTTESFYIIGWIPENEMKELIPVLEKEERIIYVQEEPDMVGISQPPTQLKNNRLFKPFETIVKMYGLPSYNEIDPTPFVAITYFLMFGIMFGDVGQGIILFLAGIFLMKLKFTLGGVIIGAGISSTLFGFVYGSVFGYEDWIGHLWLKPMDNINTMLIMGIAIGVLFIICAMIINITNGIRSKNIAKVFFDKNGVAGFIFYASAIAIAYLFLQTGAVAVPIGLMLAFFILPIIAMLLKEPVENLQHKRPFLPREKGMFFVQAFFELLEIIISFVSNTISFIRLSAFALNHAGLFMAFFILSEMVSGFSSTIVIILGNILIIGLEGLIVGIQALRLEYYELFSRFFQGNGRPYKPLKNQNL